MIHTESFYNALKNADMDFFVGVPDSLLQNLCACIKSNSPAERNIIAANEGNAEAIAAGYHIASGKYGVVYMQNSGQGNTVNPLLSLADEDVYRIPMLLIIGWRGQPGVHDGPQHVKQGKLTLPLLETMGIQYEILEDDYQPQLERAAAYMKETGCPYALVVKKGAFDSYKLAAAEPQFQISRETALETIINDIEPDSFIVSTTGKTSREIFEIRERRGEGHARDFLTVGSMGHTSSIALGMSLGSNQTIYCIDGDGSFLMHMGAAGIMAQNAKSNLKYIVINNGAHESVGGQPTICLDISVKKVLEACGISKVAEAYTCEEIKAGIAMLKEADTCAAMIIYVNQGSREDLGRPTISPENNKNDMMKLFLG